MAVVRRISLLLLLVPLAYGTASTARRLGMSAACTPPTPAPPHLPAGYQCLAASAADVIAASGGSPAITLSLVNDATAPESPPTVLRIATVPFTAPDGTRSPTSPPSSSSSAGDRSPAPSSPPSDPGSGVRAPPSDGRSIQALVPFAARQSEVFLSLWVKWSAGWVADPTVLAMSVLLGTGAETASLTLGTMSGSTVVPGLAVTAAPGSLTLDPNRVTPMALTAGTWHRWELQVVPGSTGALVRWWVDGVLTGEHADVPLWTDNPTWLAAMGWAGRPGGLSSPPQWAAEVDGVVVEGKGVEDGVIVLDNVVPPSYLGAPDRETVVLMDMRQNASLPCDTNVQFLGAGPLYFPNLLESSGCERMRDPGSDFQDAVAIFSAGNQFHLVEGRLWDDAVGNTVTVDLAPPLSLNVQVWLLDPSYTYKDLANVSHTVDARTLAVNEMSQVRQLFDDNLTGLDFTVTYWPASGTSPQQAVARASVGDVCGVGTGWTPALPWWQQDAINVYFVAPVPGSTTVASNLEGMTCSVTGDKAHAGSIVFFYMQNVTHVATLTHELGHVMALFHTAESATTCGGFSYDKQNLMYAYMADDQQTFTLGQAFRINVDSRSAANVLPPLVPRAAPFTTRTCSLYCYQPSNTCPALMRR